MSENPVDSFKDLSVALNPPRPPRSHSGVLKIPYQFKSSTSKGKLTFSKISNPVVAYSVSDLEFYSYNFVHENLLPIRLIDLDNKTILYESFNSTLKTFLVDSKSACTFSSIMPITIPYGGIIFRVPDIIRTILRSMLQFIVDLHNNEYCIVGFTLDNLVIQDGVLKFYKIQLVSTKDEKSQTNKQSRRNSDFDSLFHTMEQVFGEYKREEMPPDMDHFLNLIYNHSSRNELNDLILNHVAIMNCEERIHFIIDVQWWLELMSVEDQMKILKSMGNTQGKWKKKITDSSIGLLVDSLERNNYSDIDPKPKKKEKASGSKENEEAPRTSNSELLRFCRNTCVHFRENASKFAILVSDKHIESTIMFLFGGEIAKMQENLYKIGLDSNSTVPSIFMSVHKKLLDPSKFPTRAMSLRV